MNKVLNNYNKSKRINGTTKGKIGTVLHLIDKNKEMLSIGDKELRAKVKDYCAGLKDAVVKKAEKLEQLGYEDYIKQM